MTSDPVQPIAPDAMLGASDWDDEDLLTVVEASERLVAEIRASRERIQQADGVGSEAERQRLQELLAAVERIRAAQRNAPRSP
jgi:hypothetical protein